MVPAISFISTLMVNADNAKLTDAEFRQMVRNTLPIVEKQPIEMIANPELAEQVKKYYKE